MPYEIHEGELGRGLPCYELGQGDPLVVLRWFGPHHANPRGMERRVELSVMRPLAGHFRVCAVTRAPGMAMGTTMAQIAADHAQALKERFGGPVDVLGMSSGGSLALQLAADHPDAVRSLVVAGAAYTLPERTRLVQRRYTEAVAAGRRGAHLQAPLTGRTPLGQALQGAVMWLADPLMRPANPTDMLRFAQAEDPFDVGDRLAGLRAPTLVIGGERDLAYSPELFRQTAGRIPGGRLIIYPRTGHLGTFRHRRFAPSPRSPGECGRDGPGGRAHAVGDQR
ncbi:alpha/beta fold hydrolase [Nonomuraea sp. NPDC050536]|uniref:alpha/beta fold hydrolase n=1 Tax=Nonomuraea sp. NPDC050536 TaxID=3364366 RepID=UPI0037CB7CAD